MRFILFSNAIKDITSKFTKIKKQDYLKNAKYPIVDQSQVFIAGYTDDYESLENFDNEVIVFGDHTRIFKYIDFPIAIGADGVKVLQVDKKLFITKYVYYYLRFIKLKDAGYSRHFKFLKEVNIPLLDIEEQRRIANLLSKIENLLEKREKSIELLNRLIKNTFLDMFGDPVLDSKNWGRISLDSFGKIITGNTPPRSEKSFYDIGFIEWIKTDNLFEDRVYATKAKEYLSQHGLSVGRSVEKGSILVTCIAGSLKSIGTASLVDRKVAFNQQINAIQPFDDVDSFFLYWMFKISKHYIQDKAGKGMKKIINKSAFQNILFPKPRYELQKKFGDIALKIENTKKIYENSLNELKQLFNSTSQKAFKGELELNIITLEFEDKFPDILDEIVKDEERKNIHFEKAGNFTKETISKIEELPSDDSTMDLLEFKNLIKKTLAYEHTFEELDTKMRSKGWVIPYDEELNKKDKPFTYKDTIFELLKENQIVQEIREYKEDGELKRKILLKAKK